MSHVQAVTPTSAEVLLPTLEREFPEGPPTDEAVRAQGFTWSAGQWRKRWPAALSVPRRLAEAPERPHLTRQDVFDRARSVTTESDAVELFLLVAAWGTGTKARSIARVARVLDQPSAPARLLETHRVVRDGDPAEAYRRMYSWDHERIKYLGPAFFTKWLYFSAYDTWEQRNGPAPLILDQQVARALGWRTTGWSSSTYRTYLETAAAVRDIWAPNAPLHIAEYALFEVGRRARSHS
ncbi:8-oxoguanine DNA glycosylase OGG fold protein [Flexivirga sp.]|uniref:8-oxoguanine DNA glycosylase OGG fold protein n=1 Tax=Flexivirga sp. TaxID=1962927 RepID=UPI003F7D633E